MNQLSLSDVQSDLISYYRRIRDAMDYYDIKKQSIQEVQSSAIEDIKKTLVCACKDDKYTKSS
jgi:hypothetical protein